MISAIRSYLSTYDFNCDQEFNAQSDLFSPCAPHYQFNGVERFGNCLLKSIKKVLIKFDDADSYLCKIALAMIGIFAAIIGVLGVLLKKIGECANANAASRYECLSQLRQFYFLQTGQKDFSPNSLWTSVFGILKGALSLKTDAGKVDQQFIANILTQQQDEGLKQQMSEQYEAVWDQIQTKQQTFNPDWEAEKSQLTQLTITHPVTQQTALDFLNKLHAELVKKIMLNESMTKYNQALQQMTGTPVAALQAQ